MTNPASSGSDLDPAYFGFFECFNRGEYFEAHEVLEGLWLNGRQLPNGLFYKGLIQLAGAFVHFQKNRLQPGCSLLKLARANLEKYPDLHERLDVASLIRWITTILQRAEKNAENPLASGEPRVELEPAR